MTLEELNAMNKVAEDAKHCASSAHSAADSMARARHRGDSAEDVIRAFRAQYRKREIDELTETLDKWFPDILRETELRLKAEERAHRNESRRMRAQVDAYLAEKESGQ